MCRRGPTADTVKQKILGYRFTKKPAFRSLTVYTERCSEKKHGYEPAMGLKISVIAHVSDNGSPNFVQNSVCYQLATCIGNEASKCSIQ